MKRALVGIMLALVASSVQAGTLDVANGALVASDLAITQAILAHGGTELNPLNRSVGARVGLGAARIAVAVALPHYLEQKGHKGTAKGIKIAAFVVNGLVVSHNLRELSK